MFSRERTRRTAAAMIQFKKTYEADHPGAQVVLPGFSENNRGRRALETEIRDQLRQARRFAQLEAATASPDRGLDRAQRVPSPAAQELTSKGTEAPADSLDATLGSGKPDDDGLIARGRFTAKVVYKNGKPPVNDF